MRHTNDYITLPQYTLAPMAGYTDSAYRSIAVSFGAQLTVTEMVSAKALVMGNVLTTTLLDRCGNDTNCFVQIFGHEPSVMADSVAVLAPYGFSGIDINMGCPVRKIVTNGDGSALLENPKLAADIVKSVKLASKVPVSVKFRLGVSDASGAVHFAKLMADSGADFLTVHFRTRQQLYSGKADFSLLPAIARAVDIPVYANGDVDSKAAADFLLSNGAYGVAVGRGALGRPYIFSELRGEEYNFDILDTIAHHIALIAALKPPRVASNEMKKHIAYYLKGIKDAKPVIVAVQNATDCEEQFEMVRKFVTNNP
jgi:tRNA-dihydrouridine synthase B